MERQDILLSGSSSNFLTFKFSKSQWGENEGLILNFKKFVSKVIGRKIPVGGGMFSSRNFLRGKTSVQLKSSIFILSFFQL